MVEVQNRYSDGGWTTGAEELNPRPAQVLHVGLNPVPGRGRFSAPYGVVYTAHDPRLKRQVAINLLIADLTRDETATQRGEADIRCGRATEVSCSSWRARSWPCRSGPTGASPATAEVLFAEEYFGGGLGRTYDVRAGWRFLMLKTIAAEPSIQVVLNWPEELLERVPVN